MVGVIGKLVYKNGDVYEGQFKDDKRDGEGKIQANSLGVMIYKNGEKYDGQWSDDKKGPQGTHYYLDGSKYEGDIANNMKEGHGTLGRSRRDSDLSQWRETQGRV